MLEFIDAGGWVMYPIILCSVLAMAIIAERLWALQVNRISPRNLTARVWGWISNNQLDSKKVKELRDSSPLGRVLAAGLLNARHGREIMKEAITDTASHEIHEMQRFLNLLGTIANISPLLGLLGTVFGMVDMFHSLMLAGNTDPVLLAGGIAKALYATAGGLVVAIPALFFYRYFNRRVDEIVVLMEQQAIKLVDVMHGDRESDFAQEARAK
ncbi:MAG TPA: MotA/TolQ/ExbB proton channel family protein [Dongiaceae bacterium]|nr:MotA/TolQ/ExbB proton channel family protein [Dongiaceae bacterium]